MDNEHKDAQLVTAVVKLLVRHPESVEVTRTIDDLGVLLTLRVHAEDMAGIVGREGRTAKAIRTLLRVIGAQNDERVNLKIVEPFGAEERTQAQPAPAQAPQQFDQPQYDQQPATAPVDEEPVITRAQPEQPAPMTVDSYFNFDDIPEPLA